MLNPDVASVLLWYKLIVNNLLGDLPRHRRMLCIIIIIIMAANYIQTETVCCCTLSSEREAISHQ